MNDKEEGGRKRSRTDNVSKIPNREIWRRRMTTEAIIPYSKPASTL